MENTICYIKNNMEFKFGKYTEITEFAFKINPDYKKHGYIRFFVCPDVWDFWFIRILKGYNEEYEKQENSYILERNKIAMDVKGENLNITKLKNIIKEDDGENWDIQQSEDINKLIDMIDNGFGILNFKE